ncbi:ATP-dependent RecD-like DNA helicase [Clostridium grantii]|uniref:ATP-dependent RecD2 DNA helicase n=1 Tax=Clostridium grantii DSM 8605 TaxID=1121316 RepID=A0A1M5THU1_9CLOT|nr:ATP-dependent RecD-like DNA helicase [Clostridium grantii]SHH50385.1 exodeoxyribonuclease V alpha subunit [Clostridium grantii DSM 8605]
MSEILGVVSDIIFQNESNGYIIAKIKDDDDIHTITGFIPYIQEGINLKLTGEWFIHPKFGQQFKVQSCEEVVPNSIDGIKKYLSSGVISGIGPVTAKKIVDFFGEKTLEILDNNIERLTEIDGIGEKKAEKIAESYLNGREIQNVMIFFQTYGLTPSQCVKVHHKYGKDAIGIVKENPYMLVEDIKGIGFKTADKIAQSIGIEINSSYRIQSGIIFVLNQFCAMGNTYLPLEKLMNECEKILLVSVEDIYSNINECVLNNKIKIEDIDEVPCVFTLQFYYYELGVTVKILTLATDEYKDVQINIEEEIKEFESNNKITFAPIQKEAITGAFQNGIEIITGGPGTGKTTIIKCITEMFENASMTVFMAAPTGRAAKRMTEATGRESKTIHRLLEFGFNEEEDYNFQRGEESPLQCDVLIVDEASMIDIMLMNSLLKAIPKGTRLIIVGDADQLPSVGPGNVLSDLINSQCVKVVRLKEIFRQAEESMIVVNAHKINNGEMPVLNKKDTDFYFINEDNSNFIMDLIIELMNERLPKFNNKWDKIKHIEILSPMKKGILGIENLNENLQKVLNPKSENKEEIEISKGVFRVGDKVMQTKNNYTLKWKSGDGEEGTGVFNGDIGYIENIYKDKIVVWFDDDRKIEYEKIYFDELELAYAMTIHKSQGSEFPVVIMPMFMGPPLLMNKNLLYTGITRAKKMVVLVGNVKALNFMISNTKSYDRYSALKWRILSTLDKNIIS